MPARPWPSAARRSAPPGPDLIRVGYTPPVPAPKPLFVALGGVGAIPSRVQPCNLRFQPRACPSTPPPAEVHPAVMAPPHRAANREGRRGTIGQAGSPSGWASGAGGRVGRHVGHADASAGARFFAACPGWGRARHGDWSKRSQRCGYPNPHRRAPCHGGHGRRGARMTAGVHAHAGGGRAPPPSRLPASSSGTAALAVAAGSTEWG